MKNLTLRRLCILLFPLALTACSGEKPAESAPEATAAAPVTAQPTGKALADKYLLVDTHIDVPFRVYRNPQNVAEATEGGEFDYPRAVAGGLNVPFMSIYIPASVDEEGGAKALADELIDMVRGIVTDNPDKFALANSTAEVMTNFSGGKISMAMGMENGGPIEGDLSNVQYFYDRGIRYITLTHSKSNHISDSSYDDNKRWGGLSEFGFEVVREMNRVGIMVDVSHVSDEAFYDVMETTAVPVVATHSSARHFTPGFERNMDDDMLRKMAANGGVVQLNIGSGFISQASRDSAAARSAALKAYVEAEGIEPDTEAYKAARDKVYAEHPYVYATMDDVLDHIDHIVNVAGISHVGIGSDFDGVGDTLPVGFKDVSEYPAFVDGLIARGYSEQDIEKILGGNLMRVWKAIEDYAASAQQVKATGA
ncbi:MAG: dipeptidase [Pseudomonadales bacterium]|nr:dipeptidase [Pseudomonadales bacterium]